MILLVDARNLAYRAVYAADKEYQRTARKKHPLLIMLRLMSTLVRYYKPTSVQVFWDAPRHTVWRRKILKTYKQRDMDSHWVKDLAPDLDRTQTAARALFSYMNIYQFYRDKMEADDLIYAACKLQHNRPMMICSSDSDMGQIIYNFNSVCLYNPERSTEVPVPLFNVVLRKALMGDVTDKIPGYAGIGEKRSITLAIDLMAMERFLKDHDKKIFLRNVLLIDLALCPYLLHNQVYVSGVLGKPPEFSREKLLEVAHQHKVHGLIDDFADLVAPFKRLSADATPSTQLVGCTERNSGTVVSV